MVAPRSNIELVFAFVVYFDFLHPPYVGEVLGSSDCDEREVGVFE